MDILRQLFREEEIKRLIKENDWLKIISKEQVRDIIKTLSDEKCNNRVLRNIIITYPEVLRKDVDELKELIYVLKGYEIIHLENLFDEYPFFLKKKAYEVDNFFFIKQKEGHKNNEIKKILEDTPYMIDVTS